ncbi:MAG: FtsW/RodA/SpoVE family cell cycle protein [Clostridia bacterium]
MFNKVKGISILGKFDFVLFILAAGLAAFGFVVLRSATASMNTGATIVRTQLISICLGIAACIVTSFIDYRFYKILGYIFYAGTLLMLIYVIPFGYGRDVVGIGSNSWIVAGGFMFQPSELAKITYMMTIPAVLEKLREEFTFGMFAASAVLALAPIGLILMQTDMGTAVVFAVGLVSVLFVYGVRYRYVISAFVLTAVAAPLTYYYLLDDYQKTRIKTLLNPLEDVQGAGYQTLKAKIAIGSGGLKGSGLFQGLQSQQNGAIPVKESDFIFSVIGEELGFIGAVSVILVTTVLLLWCMRVAIRAKDRYGSMMAAGLTGMLAFHFIENIGMNIGIMPVTGIPLPFISAGGSSMLVNFIAIGLIMSVSLRSKLE